MRTGTSRACHRAESLLSDLKDAMKLRREDGRIFVSPFPLLSSSSSPAPLPPPLLLSSPPPAPPAPLPPPIAQLFFSADNESRVSVASAAHSLLPEMMETNSSTRMPWTEMSARKMDPEEDKRRLGEPEEKGGKEEARMKLSPFAKLWHKGGGSEEEEIENGNGGQGEKERVTSGGISARL
eukprot:750683-Hanusia_phi.AAC.1